MSVLRLTVDRQGKQLVNYLGSVVSVPALFQSNVVPLQISIVDPSGNVTAPYTLQDMSAYGLRVSIGDTPTGTSGGPTPLALQDTFVWNAGGQYFSADLALNVVAIDSFIGSAASKTAYFEINLTSSGNRETIFQAQITLKAVVDEATSTSPGTSDVYLTKAESLALFQPRVGAVGDRLVLKSANGVYAVELGCNDDGSLLANIITL